MLLATMSCTDDYYKQRRTCAPKIETCTDYVRTSLTAWLVNVHTLYPVHGFGMEQS